MGTLALDLLRTVVQNLLRAAVRSERSRDGPYEARGYAIVA